MPDFNLLVGGFPCQSHSMLGKRKGLNDSRGELFFDLVRILKDKHPKYFVFENVKGLLSSNNGEAFRIILASLDKLGYGVAWSVLNGTFFGNPQARERLAIIGIYGEQPTKEISDLKKYQSLRTRFEKDRFLSYSRNKNKVTIKNTVNTITASYKGLGGYNEPTFIEDDGTIRKLTPIECERLQGFPDNWTKLSSNGKHISDTQRYKMCGNAICVPMFESVFKILLNHDHQVSKNRS